MKLYCIGITQTPEGHCFMNHQNTYQ